MAEGNSDFFMFRVQMFQNQYDLLHQSYPHPSEILKNISWGELRKDSKSRSYFTFGVRMLVDGVYYFKLVRRRKIKVTEIDHEKLVEVEHPDNPYVHVFILCEEQVLVVNRDSHFSNDVKFSTRIIKDLLSVSEMIQEYGLSVEVSPISDPVQIVEYIQKARHISKLGVVVRRENVFDASEYNRNFKEYTSRVGGEKTKTEVSGGMIKQDAAEDMVRAAASTGDDAYVDLKLPGERRYSRKSLFGTTVSFEWRAKVEGSLVEIWKMIKERYKMVRGDDGGDE